MNTERLLKLASFLRKLPPERFDFGKIVQHETPRCGTIGCAIGWTPAVFPDLVEWTKDWSEVSWTYPLTLISGCDADYDEVAQELFEMGEDDALNLFTPRKQSRIGLDNLDHDATPSQVADLIEEYIRLKS